MFKRPRPWHHPPFHPQMPFGPAMIREMSQLVFLWNIIDEPDGTTGYELQKNYNVKQTNVYRILREMEQEGYLSSEETINKGRAQRLYKITEIGKEYLRELRERWTTRVAFLTDVVPFEKPKFPFARKRFENEFLDFVKEAQTKEEIIDVLEGFKEHLQRRRTRMEHQIKAIESNIDSLTEFSREIMDLKNYDPTVIEQLIKKLFQKERR